MGGSESNAKVKLKLPYQKLRREEEYDEYADLREKVIGRLRSSSRFKIKKRLRVKIIPRVVTRKARLVKLAWKKVCRRLRESHSHFGDIFSGNYLFMQVSPTLKYHHHHHHYKSNFIH